VDQIHLPGVERDVFMIMAECGLLVNGGISGVIAHMLLKED